jgi:hypothetical protein
VTASAVSGQGEGGGGEACRKMRKMQKVAVMRGVMVREGCCQTACVCVLSRSIQDRLPRETASADDVSSDGGRRMMFFVGVEHGVVRWDGEQ